jgi:tryptophan synthase alpha chain
MPGRDGARLAIDPSGSTLRPVSRIPTIFQSLRGANRKALMPFICGSHPRPGDTARLLPALARAGASIVEVGYPFSDPIADGPVIAAAMHEALVVGSTPADVHGEIAAARAAGGGGATVGVVAMVSVSIVLRIGAERFIADAKRAGIDGFIFPDAPLEESRDLIARTKDAGLTASLLVAPATSAARAAEIARACTGFVYVLARAGITGEAGDAGIAVESIARRVKELRSATDLPLAVGFGISSAEHVRQVVHGAGADAAIVGSALVRRLSDAHGRGVDPVAEAEVFVRELATGLG